MTLDVKGCPWCGGQPTPAIEKVRNCGEPYFVVRLTCRACGVSMVAVASEASCDEAARVGRERYTKGEPLVLYETLLMRAAVTRQLLPRWNTRAV